LEEKLQIPHLSFLPLESQPSPPATTHVAIRNVIESDSEKPRFHIFPSSSPAAQMLTGADPVLFTFSPRSVKAQGFVRLGKESGVILKIP
jgi:hypothetical protein